MYISQCSVGRRGKKKISVLSGVSEWTRAYILYHRHQAEDSRVCSVSTPSSSILRGRHVTGCTPSVTQYSVLSLEYYSHDYWLYEGDLELILRTIEFLPCAMGYILIEFSLNNLLKHQLPHFVDEETGTGRLSDIPSVCSRPEGVMRCIWFSLHLPPMFWSPIASGTTSYPKLLIPSPSHASVVGGFGNISRPDSPSPEPPHSICPLICLLEGSFSF